MTMTESWWGGYSGGGTGGDSCGIRVGGSCCDRRIDGNWDLEVVASAMMVPRGGGCDGDSQRAAPGDESNDARCGEARLAIAVMKDVGNLGCVPRPSTASPLT